LGGETMNVDLVEVPMRVRSTHPIAAADIAVKENGVEQTIREVRADRGPARFLFVIDRSLSMGDGKLDAALRAVEEESKLLRPDDHVEVVLFNHNVMPPRPLMRAEHVQPSGGTSLRDAVIYQSQGNPSGWRAIAIEPRRRGIEILNARKGYFAS